MPPQLVRELVLTAELETGEKLRLAELREQHQRLVTLRLPQKLCLRALRVGLRRTWGGLPPAVYKISVF